MAAIQLDLSKSINLPLQQPQLPLFKKIAQIFQITLDASASMEQQNEACFLAILDHCRQKNWEQISKHQTDLAKLSDRFGRTVLTYVLKVGEIELAKELLRNDLFIYALDHKGNTPLHFACKNGDLELIALTLKHCSIDDFNIYAETPIEIAVNANHLSGVLSLFASGKRFLVAESLNKSGDYYYSAGSLDKALHMYDESLKIWEMLGNDGMVAHTLNSMGLCYHCQDKIDMALEMHEKSLKIKQNLCSDHDPFIATSLNNIGLCYYSRGEIDAALEMFTKAFQIATEKFGEEHAIVALYLTNIAISF